MVTKQIMAMEERMIACDIVKKSDNLYLIAGASSKRYLKLWKMDKTMNLSEVITLVGYNAGIASCSFTSDGKRIATGTKDNLIKLWDVDDAFKYKGNITVILTLTAHQDIISHVTFSPDDSKLLSSGYDRQLYIWEAPGYSQKTTEEEMIKK